VVVMKHLNKNLQNCKLLNESADTQATAAVIFR